MSTKCPFQVGDCVRILPEMRYWEYFINDMRKYVGTEMTIQEIETEYNGEIKLWMSEDYHDYFWNPQYCELVSVPIVVDTEDLL